MADEVSEAQRVKAGLGALIRVGLRDTIRVGLMEGQDPDVLQELLQELAIDLTPEDAYKCAEAIRIGLYAQAVFPEGWKEHYSSMKLRFFASRAQAGGHWAFPQPPAPPPTLLPILPTTPSPRLRLAPPPFYGVPGCPVHVPGGAAAAAADEATADSFTCLPLKPGAANLPTNLRRACAWFSSSDRAPSSRMPRQRIEEVRRVAQEVGEKNFAPEHRH